MNILFIFAALGAVLVVVLALYALRQWRSVWRRERDRAAVKTAAREDQIYSARTLAQSMVDGDLNLSEGAIRLKVLLDHLHPDGSGAVDYPDIYALYDATAHMPRGAQRKAYAPADIDKLDAQRENLESQYRDAVLAQTRQLLFSIGSSIGSDSIEKTIH